MTNNTISLRSLLEKEKLNGINFLDWFRNLRIVLKQERKEYVIEEPVPDEPAANAPRADKDKFKKHMDDMVDVGCLMLATMDSELQKQHENMVAYEMIQNLKEIYEGQARQERYETSKALFQCKMTEGTPVGAHVIKMMGYVQTLEKLGFPLKNELATDLILQSLPGSFKPFVLNFNMNEINKTLPQLLGMLRTVESDMKKDGSKSILLVREAKGKGKKVAKSKGSEVKKAKAVGASVSGIYVIDVNMSTSSSWVLDTGCGSHICTSVQGLHMRRNLAKGDVDLRVGNGARVSALAKTPHEMWTGKRPSMSFMKIWGCKAYVKHQMSTKLEPKSHKLSSPDSEKSLEAMRSEMDSMSDNQVWTLVEPPEGIKPIGCKWVFKKKTDMDCNVQTYKGRLVAKGYRQIHGIDYDETFSPVAMFKSIRILLAIAAFHDYEN
ncbi:hypothetical protein V6N13_019731 [Hibiscus sabdariffa]